MSSSLSYRFGDFELDLALFELRRCGEPLKLDPRSFTLLRYLVEHNDRVVLKEELLAEVWPDTAVTPSVLPSSIWRIRAALGQRAKDEEPIQTLHRRGYRLNMAVTPLPRPCSGRGMTDSRSADWRYSRPIEDREPPPIAP